MRGLTLLWFLLLPISCPQVLRVAPSQIMMSCEGLLPLDADGSVEGDANVGNCSAVSRYTAVSRMV